MATAITRLLPAESQVNETPGPRNRTLAIFLVSVLGLFLELMLIRWVGTEIRIFAYLQNTVLIVCFLGLGLGCFTCRQPIVLRHSLLALLALVVILSVPAARAVMAKITDLLSVLSDLLIWENAVSEGPITSLLRVSMGLALTLVLMVLLWEVFVPLGRLLGRLVDDHPRTIWAYSINVAGSLVGIWLFVALSGLSLPPVVWLGAASLMLLCFLPRCRSLELGLVAALPAVALLAGGDRAAITTVWSPYQKLELMGQTPGGLAFQGRLITVNNAGYQAMIDLSHEAVAANPEIPVPMRRLSQYDLPLRFKPKPERVLIVGAGSGNDVAGALRGGAEHITAVEIDPVIIELGRRHHPERPYDSPRVTVVNDDARAFFATTNDQFDLVIFGLLDSHTTTAMTNARLDHYVYTRESLERARALLKDGGVVVLSFEAQKPYIADRMARCIREVFGHPPLAFRVPGSALGWGGAFFVAGDQQVIGRSLAADTSLARQIASWQADRPITLTYATPIATDDWPYIYLEKPRIPVLYYLLAGLMVGLLIYSKRRLGLADFTSNWQRSNWHFFFLGAAFLLLEVQNISKAAVVLGNTWVVNAVIISAVLTMILLANLIAAVLPRVPRRLTGAALIGSCLGLYFVDLAQFAHLPYVSKAIAAGLLTTLPMLFAGILFIDSFRQAKNKNAALGANLLGSIAGGLLQSITFVVGIKALLLIVAWLYLIALLLPEKDRASGEQKRLDHEVLGSEGQVAADRSDSTLSTPGAQPALAR